MCLRGVHVRCMRERDSVGLDGVLGRACGQAGRIGSLFEEKRDLGQQSPSCRLRLCERAGEVCELDTG